MHRMSPPPLALLLTALVAVTAAAEPKTAWDVTERDRGLPRAVALASAKGPDTVLFLIDPTPSLGQVDFLGAFAAAQKKNGANGRIGVLEMGGKRAAFGTDADISLQRMLKRPAAFIRNVYAGVRQAIPVLKKRSGERVLVIVTLENGDLEDEDGQLERTAMLLRRAKIKCHVIAREVVVSDNYARRRLGFPPRDAAWAGPESALTEFPQGWLMQGYPNEQASSGFATYGLTRLAAATGGRVYLSNLPSEGHKCTGGGLNCLLCSGDHAPTDRHFLAAQLKALAPSVESRRDIWKQAGKDPYLAATLRVWDDGARVGLFRSGPTLRSEGRMLKRVSPRANGFALEFDRRFEQDAKRALRLVETCTKLIADLDATFEKAKAKVAKAKTAKRGGGGGTYRYRANADVTRALLVLTRLNLKLYAHWCREVAPVLARARRPDVAAPEVPYDFGDDGLRLEGSSMYHISLCHGFAPLRRLKFPGRVALKADFDEFEREFARIMRIYAHTPYAEVLRRSALVWPHLAVRGQERDPPRGNVGSEKSDTTTRPARQPAPSAGESGGTTTGGG